MQNNLVSILIPAYNSECYLAEAIDSCLKQTYKNIEVVVVDDGSTDATPELLQYFSLLDKRVKALRYEKNMGISYARNFAFQNSAGAYIAIMDSDDLMSPDRIKKQLKAIEKVDIVYSSYLQADENGKVQGMVEPLPPEKMTMDEILAHQVVPHPTMMVRRKVMEDNPYNNDYRVNDDLYLICRLFKHGYKFKKIEEPLLIKRYQRESVSITKDKEVKRITKEIKKEYE